MKYSFFPGCTMSSTGIEYGKSLRYVNKIIGLELIEIKDWNCCGASFGPSTSKQLGVALPARNIALCEQQGLGLPLAVACAACYSRMRHAYTEAKGTDEQREKLSRLINMPIKGNLEVVNILDVYSTNEVREGIKKAAKKSFNNLRVACYYGCLSIRPTDITGVANVENPMLMDEILESVGCKPVEWAFKSECCGGNHHIDLPGFSKQMLKEILKNARANGAQAIATACPLCMMNIDMRQAEINKDYNENFDMPVFFFTELLALSMGANIKKAGVSTHFHPAVKLAEQALAGKAG
ncbi:MAG: CoB--CoM heterodisulfide reductase iron-sulfur subunit B family protein [Treponema sp.]|nr:CoB--CoM heterodisulfide reductase iron-sulfur subunit B family protein [Treponema sp.]